MNINKLSVVKTMLLALLSTLLVSNITYAAEQQRMYEADAAEKQQSIKLFEDAFVSAKAENVELIAQVESLSADLAVATAIFETSEVDPISDIPYDENATESVSYSKERLPEGVATNRYDCEGYKFPVGTQQWLLQGQCEIDWETGIRIYTRDTTRYRCVAMGTAYGIDIGDAWEVTLNNGYSFPIVLADYQHDISFIDPNDFGERFAYDDKGNIVDVLRNYDGDECVHVLEFIVDLGAIPQAAKEAGGMHGLTIFGGKFGDDGNIAKIKYLGRVWEP